MGGQRGRVETTAEEREEIVELAATVFNFAFENYRIFDDSVPWCMTEETCSDRGFEWEDGRDLTADDIKITQVWSKNQSKAAHLGHPNGKPYFRLGIRFTSWRRNTPDDRLGLIIHELGHLFREQPPHREAFWHRIADAARILCERYDEAVAELGFDFSTYYLKNDILKSIRWASRNEMDADKDEILQSTSKRLDYPADAVGEFRNVNVTTADDANDDADLLVPITDVRIEKYHDFNDHFVWNQMIKQSPAGFTPDQRVQMTKPVPVRETSDGYTSQGTTAEWEAITAKRIWEHQDILNGDRWDPPEIPVQVKEEG